MSVGGDVASARPLIAPSFTSREEPEIWPLHPSPVSWVLTASGCGMVFNAPSSSHQTTRSISQYMSF